MRLAVGALVRAVRAVGEDLMAGYYQSCNCCGKEFSNALGARQYLEHLSQSSYYGVRMSPEATWALGAKARAFLTGGKASGEPLVCGTREAGSTPAPPSTFQGWVDAHYGGWRPAGPDIIPCAYGWLSFAGSPKAQEYEAWRRKHGIGAG